MVCTLANYVACSQATLGLEVRPELQSGETILLECHGLLVAFLAQRAETLSEAQSATDHRTDVQAAPQSKKESKSAIRPEDVG